MKKAFVEKKLKMMSDGKKTHVVHFYNNGKLSVSTTIGKGISTKKLASHLRYKGWKVSII